MNVDVALSSVVNHSILSSHSGEHVSKLMIQYPVSLTTSNIKLIVTVKIFELLKWYP